MRRWRLYLPPKPISKRTTASTLPTLRDVVGFMRRHPPDPREHKRRMNGGAP